ncbi:pectinesterase inhibitor 10-like isoform X1 [Hypomesus transpacificus]|uniref:pectinesterase inhibitor 10-like isoform X1 n=1 Tax=Hypomesus transpacificus TaxID=137520 RepID=UPI001F086A6B|nr:pectinesterase inhibitor 10-like isoform X1 [Hypomesus transpacificus]XP_046891672.1 pectinesterase inhibitor 10-like isoform X1 [Hypomesus transpacificus]XP_046891674.1 pectinesterase inhibitor 10-like isoform X1 [Hypomesus transpacificus]
MATCKDRGEEDASPIEQSHVGAFQSFRSVLPSLDPPSDDSPETACLVTRTSPSSNPIAPSSPSTSHPHSFSDPPPPPPYPSSSSIPTHSFPAFPSSSSYPLSSYPASSIRPASPHTSLPSLLPSSSPLHPTPSRQLSQPRLGVEHLEELSHCASVSLEEQHQGRLVLGEVARSLGSLAVSLQGLVETQKEFSHDSLKMQREMVDTLRQFSTNALSLLRHKVDGHPPL